MSSQTQRMRDFDNHCWPSDRVMAPCAEACPLGTDVAGYIMAILIGDLDEAYRILALENPLPAVCGRICHHPCETHCVRNRLDQPIAIRALKRFAIEQASERVRHAAPVTAKKTGQGVAVVGSGPSGLAAAHDLARLGHEVTVFEKSSQPGGLLNLAVPPFILPQKVLRADLERIAALGVRFQTGREIRGRSGIEGLFRDGYAAILLGMGALESLSLKGIESSSARVETGLSFLMRMQENPQERIRGRILIIGGGNVAIDAARLCLRQGAREVNVFCIEQAEAMPAFLWERSRAEKEGIGIFDGWGLISATEVGTGPLRVRFARVREIKAGPDGALRPLLDKGKGYEIEAESIILSVGQRFDRSVLEGFPFRLTEKGTLATDSHFMVQDLPAVFAAGDMVIYPGTVVDAMGTGKKAARAIDRFLRGNDRETPSAAVPLTVRSSTLEEDLLKVFPPRDRQRMPEITVATARKSLQEVEKGYSRPAALKEASRCLNCAMCSHCVMERHRICRETAKRLWSR